MTLGHWLFVTLKQQLPGGGGGGVGPEVGHQILGLALVQVALRQASFVSHGDTIGHAVLLACEQSVITQQQDPRGPGGGGLGGGGGGGGGAGPRG